MSKQHQQSVIEFLLSEGWSACGQTQMDTVRIGTRKSPVFGGLGGELRNFGGRPRFEKGSRRVTVGPRTVCLYLFENKQASQFQNFKTSQIDAIRQAIAGGVPI